jgi:hypothetical protein
MRCPDADPRGFGAGSPPAKFLRPDEGKVMPDNDLQRFWAGRAAAARVIAGVATISAALMGFAGSLAAQTVQNGSFSNSTGNLSSTYVPSAANLSNWTVSGTNTNPDPCVVFGNAFGTCGYSPVNVSGLGTDPGATPYFGAGAWSGTNAIISQTISGLQIGRKYLISFYQAAVEDANVTDNGIYWSVNLGTGTALSSTLMNIPSGGASAWAANTATMIFTATSASETLSFLAAGGSGGAPPLALLDGVSISQVPEPASLALLGLGVAGVMGLKKRRARAVAA